jgi:GNAT superfamily N-acetyltransferase
MLRDGLHDVPPGKVAAVVTHLEMRAPQSRNASAPTGVTFTRISPDVTEYRDLFRRVGQDWLWFGRTLLQDEDLAAILADDKVQIFTLMKDGEPEALLELDFRVAGECELAYFGLTRALIGAGAGGFLMDRAVEISFGASIDRFHVHTCTIDSPQALGFYQRSGFVPVRQQVEIADDPRIAHGYPRTLGPHVPIFDP